MLTSSSGAVKRRESSFEMWLILSPSHTCTQCPHPHLQSTQVTLMQGQVPPLSRVLSQGFGENSLEGRKVENFH